MNTDFRMGILFSRIVQVFGAQRNIPILFQCVFSLLKIRSNKMK